MQSNLLCTPLTDAQREVNAHLAKEAADHAIYAILSNNAYGPDHPSIPLPAEWSERPEWRKEGKDGFAMALFERRVNGDPGEAVIAFRGTDQKRDWLQNLAPFFSKQAPQAETEYDNVVREYSGTPARILATGHSLGGGLAFHLSFTKPGVDAVAFNSSPVTQAGFAVVTQNKQISISEKGEALGKLRDGADKMKLVWREVKEIEFNFVHGSPLRQHGIEGLAVNLIKLGARKSGVLAALIAAHCPDR